jgi:O-antigen/teichoic acid export membrane protein
MSSKLRISGNNTNAPSPQSEQRIKTNIIWNLLGSVTPLIVGLITIPILIHGIGNDRFGVLSIAWMIIGYFSLFDFGLGRVATKLIADRLATEKITEIPPLIWTTLSITFIFGVFGGTVVAAITPWIIESGLKIPQELQPETISAFYLLAISMPLITCSIALRGVLEGYQRFDLVNYLRLPLGILTFLGPLLVSLYSKQLHHIVLALVVIRFIVGFIYFLLMYKVVAGFNKSLKWDSSHLRPLFNFGGWLTISNIIGPIMVYFDRFFIGSIISLAAVTYYATPYEIITKLWILPTGIIAVLFPAFAHAFIHSRFELNKLYLKGIISLAVLIFPISLFIIAFAPEGLTLWIDAEFSSQSYKVLQWLTLGVVINCIALIPYTMIQSIGRADLTAKVHMCEFPFYLLALYWALSSYGIVGAAIVWTARIVVDTVIWCLISRIIVKETKSSNSISLIILFIYTTIALTGMGLDDFYQRLVFFIGALSAIGITIYIKRHYVAEHFFLNNKKSLLTK